jgi:hypothetical protein
MREVVVDGLGEIELPIPHLISRQVDNEPSAYPVYSERYSRL